MMGERLYIRTPEGDIPFTTIEAVKFPETEKPQNPFDILGGKASFSCVIKATNEMTERLNMLTGALKSFTVQVKVQTPDYIRRIYHLARHGKNWRIRKKNQKRILDIMGFDAYTEKLLFFKNGGNR